MKVLTLICIAASSSLIFAETNAPSTNVFQTTETTCRVPTEAPVKVTPESTNSAVIVPSPTTSTNSETSLKQTADKTWETTKDAGREVGEVAKDAAGVALQGTAKAAESVTSALEKTAQTLKNTARKLEGKEEEKK